MAITRTLSQMRTEVRNRADMRDDGNFILDSELNNYINESIGALYDLLLDGEGAKLFATNSPILTKAGQFAYQLPNDFYKLNSVHVLVDGNYKPGIPADVSEYPTLALNPPHPHLTKYYIRFNFLTGERFLFVFPAPDVNDLAVTYIPHAPQLVLDTDQFDGINNWHEYVVTDAAIKCLQKEESDTGPLQGRLERITQDIRDHIRSMDVGTPAQIRDVSNTYYDFEPFWLRYNK